MTMRASSASAPCLVHQQGVDVHFRQPGQLADHFRQAQQHVLQRIHVDRRAVAERAQQGRDAGAPDQVARQIVVERRQGHRAIPEGFDIDAAGAEHDHRPQHRVGGHAQQHLARVRAGRHGLDDNAVQRGIGAQALHVGQHLAEGGAHRLAARQSQAHAVDVGLVGDVRRVDLHRHREAHLLRHQHRLHGIARDQGLRDRDVEGRQQRLRFHLVQQVAAMRQGALDDQARAFDVRRGLLRQRPRRLHQLALVFVKGGEEGKHLDRRFRRGEVGNSGLLEQAPALVHLGLAHPAGQHRLARGSSPPRSPPGPLRSAASSPAASASPARRRRCRRRGRRPPPRGIARRWRRR